ncbi:MAG: hypothetical protein P4K83_03365 [Terracidiphilus sp.]|nr:hypothetical protein [Terracidiphilus sp.]
MSERIKSGFGYTVAALTLVVALLVPFIVMGGISKVVARAGFHVDPVYTGGTVARTIERAGYTMMVYEPVRPHLMQRGGPFVQVTFAPASALPATMDEAIDLDGDGQPDVQVRFAVPQDANAPLHGTVEALNGKYKSVAEIGNRSATELLARTDGRVLLRVPLADKR